MMRPNIPPTPPVSAIVLADSDVESGFVLKKHGIILVPLAVVPLLGVIQTTV